MGGRRGLGGRALFMNHMMTLLVPLLKASARQRFTPPFVSWGQSRAPAGLPPRLAPMQNRLPIDAPGIEGEFQRVEVQRSRRRKKTISAEIVDDALIVSIPDRLSRAEEQEWVARMSARMSERKRRDRLNSDGALARRARELADRYLDGVRPSDIAWVTNQKSRWGSCSPDDGSIRLSLELSNYPTWVRDYVIIHELAHLIVPDHSDRFWRLVDRYPLTERARGFLIAKGMEEG